jgi:hypothetical protein
MLSIRPIVQELTAWLRTYGIALMGVLSFAAVGLPYSTQLSSNDRSTRDLIRGSWSDACPCLITCPCWSSTNASVRLCANVQVFSITQATIDGHSLKDKHFAVIGLPGGPFDLPHISTVLVEDQADERVVGDIIQVLFGSYEVKMQVVKISSDLSKSRQRIKIPGLLEYEVEALSPEATPEDQVRTNLYRWLSNPRQGRVKKVVLRLENGDITYTGTNAILADLSY